MQSYSFEINSLISEHLNVVNEGSHKDKISCDFFNRNASTPSGKMLVIQITILLCIPLTFAYGNASDSDDELVFAHIVSKYNCEYLFQFKYIRFIYFIGLLKTNKLFVSSCNTFHTGVTMTPCIFSV